MDWSDTIIKLFPSLVSIANAVYNALLGKNHPYIKKQVRISSLKIIPKKVDVYGGNRAFDNINLDTKLRRFLIKNQRDIITNTHRKAAYLPIESKSGRQEQFLINVTTSDTAYNDWLLLLNAIQFEIENYGDVDIQSIDIIAAYSIRSGNDPMPLLSLDRATFSGIPVDMPIPVNAAYAASTDDPTSLLVGKIASLDRKGKEIILYHRDTSIARCLDPAQYLAMTDTAYLSKVNFSESKFNYFWFFGWNVDRRTSVLKLKDNAMGRTALTKFAESVISIQKVTHKRYTDFVSFNTTNIQQTERVVKAIKKLSKK